MKVGIVSKLATIGKLLQKGAFVAGATFFLIGYASVVFASPAAVHISLIEKMREVPLEKGGLQNLLDDGDIQELQNIIDEKGKAGGFHRNNGSHDPSILEERLTQKGWSAKKIPAAKNYLHIHVIEDIAAKDTKVGDLINGHKVTYFDKIRAKYKIWRISHSWGYKPLKKYQKPGPLLVRAPTFKYEIVLEDNPSKISMLFKRVTNWFKVVIEKPITAIKNIYKRILNKFRSKPEAPKTSNVISGENSSLGGRAMEKVSKVSITHAKTSHYSDMEHDIIESYESRGDKVEIEPSGSRGPDILGVDKDGKKIVGEIKKATEIDRDLQGYWSQWNSDQQFGGKPEDFKLGDVYSDNGAVLSKNGKGWAAVIDGQLRGYCLKVDVSDGQLVVQNYSNYENDVLEALEYLKKQGRIRDYVVKTHSSGNAHITISYDRMPTKVGSFGEKTAKNEQTTQIEERSGVKTSRGVKTLPEEVGKDNVPKFPIKEKLPGGVSKPRVRQLLEPEVRSPSTFSRVMETASKVIKTASKWAMVISILYEGFSTTYEVYEMKMAGKTVHPSRLLARVCFGFAGGTAGGIALGAALAWIPVAGPIIGGLAGGFLGAILSEQLFELIMPLHAASWLWTPLDFMLGGFLGSILGFIFGFPHVIKGFFRGGFIGSMLMLIVFTFV